MSSRGGGEAKGSPLRLIPLRNALNYEVSNLQFVLLCLPQQQDCSARAGESDAKTTDSMNTTQKLERFGLQQDPMISVVEHLSCMLNGGDVADIVQIIFMILKGCGQLREGTWMMPLIKKLSEQDQVVKKNLKPDEQTKLKSLIEFGQGNTQPDMEDGGDDESEGSENAANYLRLIALANSLFPQCTACQLNVCEVDSGHNLMTIASGPLTKEAIGFALMLVGDCNEARRSWIHSVKTMMKLDDKRYVKRLPQIMLRIMEPDMHYTDTLKKWKTLLETHTLVNVEPTRRTTQDEQEVSMDFVLMMSKKAEKADARSVCERMIAWHVRGERRDEEDQRQERKSEKDKSASVNKQKKDKTERLEGKSASVNKQKNDNSASEREEVQKSAHVMRRRLGAPRGGSAIAAGQGGGVPKRKLPEQQRPNLVRKKARGSHEHEKERKEAASFQGKAAESKTQQARGVSLIAAPSHDAPFDAAPSDDAPSDAAPSDAAACVKPKASDLIATWDESGSDGDSEEGWGE